MSLNMVLFNSSMLYIFFTLCLKSNSIPMSIATAALKLVVNVSHETSNQSASEPHYWSEIDILNLGRTIKCINIIISECKADAATCDIE